MQASRSNDNSNATVAPKSLFAPYHSTQQQRDPHLTEESTTKSHSHGLDLCVVG
eukprot:c29204_g5_i1 orf=18-179(+)